MLERKSYVPLLYARLAEIRALRELPSSSKSFLIPIVKLRPWLNSKHLKNAFDVIEEAVGDRLYGLDLDEFKHLTPPDPDKPAQVEFSQLFISSNGFENYYKVVDENLNRVPVFRNLNKDDAQIDKQLEHVKEIDRGLFVRIDSKSPGSYLEVAQKVIDSNIDNTVFVFDCGWGKDILLQVAVCTNLINSLLDLSEGFEIVVAGSSFPDSFSNKGQRFEIRTNERILFQNVRSSLNRGNLVYGDWGSTRPPAEPVPMKNVPRIDSAFSDKWICWRSESGESYRDIAKRVIEDPDWSGDIGIWGEYMIESSVNGGVGTIRSPAMAAAVRVNLHLHQQANLDNPDGLHVFDEPVGDDL